MSLVLHGEDAQIVPVQDHVNTELLEFLRGFSETSRRGDRQIAAASTAR